jgi:uncharacterized membrane protein YjjP (DUF1212 family)
MGLDPKQAAGAAFVVEIATALHKFGTPAHRLENALVGLSAKLGLEGQFFSTPTSILMGFGPPASQQTAIVRVQPGEVDLGKLADLDALADAVARGEISLADGVTRVRAIVGRRPTYGAAAQIAAVAIASATASVFFGGGSGELATAGAAGLVIGCLSQVLSRLAASAGVHVYELAAAFVTAAMAYTASALGWPVNHRVATLAGLIVLVPGLSLTLAIAELATRNLVSGTARLTAAGISFLKIAFGVAFAEAALGRLLGPPGAGSSPPPPGWTEPPGVLIAATAFAVLFQVKPRMLAGVVLACASGFYGARLGAGAVGPELGASVGALVVAIASNTWARIADRPALVPLVPGILLLVPGSLGFRSLSSLLEGDVIAGVDTGFTMTLVAVSIVVGLLIANAVVSPRRNL